MRNLLLAFMTILIVAISIVLLMYATEIYLAYEEYEIELGTTERIRRAAKKAGAVWDERDKIEVIRDLRQQGIEAHPAMAPSVFTETDGIVINGERIFPFGGISRTVNVFCNETGAWSIYESDEYGFNNPVGSWSVPVDIVFIGDSFIHGACVGPGEDIAAQVRRAGFTTLNLGMGGTGPLIYLGVLREYARAVKPRYVVWSFYAVDIRDSIYERESTLLRRYLEDPQFSQKLIARQSKLDRKLRQYYETGYQKRLDELVQRREQRREIIMKRLINQGLRLHKLRQRLVNMGQRPLVTEGRETEKLELLHQIMDRAKSEVEGWGGKLVFMYLPDWYTYGAKYDTYGIKIDKNFLLRQDVLRLVRQLDIPVIDVQGELFDRHPDPLSLYNFRTYGHYTLSGYTLVSQHIVRFFKQMGEIGQNELATKSLNGK